jgi:hypothetical protein
MSGGLLNFPGTDAGGADAHFLGCPVDEGVNRLQVQIPAAFRDIVGVADAVTELRTAATDFANLSHITESP